MSKQQDELLSRTPRELATYIVDYEFTSPAAKYRSRKDLAAYYTTLIETLVNSAIQVALDKVENNRKNYTIDQCSIAFHNAIEEVRKDYE